MTGEGDGVGSLQVRVRRADLVEPFRTFVTLLLPGPLPELRGKKQMAWGKGQNGISVAAGGETRKEEGHARRDETQIFSR